MLGLDSRAARVTWTVFLLLLTLETVWLVRQTILIFVIAILLAYLLGPAVNFVEAFVEKKLPRGVALALVYIIFIGLVGAGVSVIGSQVAQEAVNLGKALPRYIQNPQLANDFPLPDALKPYREAIVDTIKQQWESRSGEIVPMLTEAGKNILSALSNALYLILIPILSFFFLKDAQGIRDTLIEQFPQGTSRNMASALIGDIHTLLVHFMRAMVLLALSTFGIFAITLGLLGVPYSILLSAMAGMAEFVPVAGPVLTGITIVLVSGVAGYQHLMWIVVFLIVYRLFLDYVLNPFLMGHGVELPPLAIMFGVLAGEQVGGILGMFLSIPVLATLRIIYLRYRKARQIAN